MKPIIIFLLVVILGFVAYDFYKDWERFHAPNYHYTTDSIIDQNYYDQEVLLDYEEAKFQLNIFVKQQWTANDIDVRAPENDDEQTNAAVINYAKKLAHVNYLENKLSKSEVYKKQGWSNRQIADFENNRSTPEQEETKSQKNLLYQLFQNEISNSQKIGSKNALIYEVQKTLIKKGYQINLDGVFANETVVALSDFESKNNLFPDGKIDVLSFEVLMR